MYNDQLVYKVVIWVFFLISLWKENVALSTSNLVQNKIVFVCYKNSLIVWNKLWANSGVRYSMLQSIQYCHIFSSVRL